MNKIIKTTTILALGLILTISANAQFGPGGPGSGAPGTSPVPPDYGNTGAVPFDGGLSLILLAAGAGVGAKRKRLMQNA